MSDLTGEVISDRCPRCGCFLLQNKRGNVWCTFVGGRGTPPCTYGIDHPRVLGEPDDQKAEAQEAKLHEIKPHEATDKPVREMLRKILERPEPIDGCLVLLFNDKQEPELHNSGITQMEMTYLLAFLQANVMDNLRSKEV
jgi:uncharacterized Zn finger protein (UPF0148 family)